jgi:hypothetical protein
VDGGAVSNRSLRKRNRSLDGSRSRFRILKNHGAETRSEFRRLRCERPEFLRQRPGSWQLTPGKVGTSASTRSSRGETTVAGWGARIRTWEWRNQNRLRLIEAHLLVAAFLFACRAACRRRSRQRSTTPASHGPAGVRVSAMPQTGERFENTSVANRRDNSPDFRREQTALGELRILCRFVPVLCRGIFASVLSSAAERV